MRWEGGGEGRGVLNSQTVNTHYNLKKKKEKEKNTYTHAQHRNPMETHKKKDVTLTQTAAVIQGEAGGREEGGGWVLKSQPVNTHTHTKKKKNKKKEREREHNHSQ